MNSTIPAAAPDDVAGAYCPYSSAVSWPAIVAGGVIATSVSLALLVLGSSLGLAVVSPLAGREVSASEFTLGAAVWLIVMQWFASGVGAYMTGRLRKRWAGLHTHEVFFRDTAHGLLTWALATLIAAVLFVAAASSAFSGGAHAAHMMASGPMPGNASDQNGSLSDPFAYYIDGLYRTPNPANTPDRDVRMETARIFAMDVKNDVFPESDKAYLSQLIVARTNVTPAEANSRVNAAITQANADKEKAKAAADKARKIAAKTSLFTALSMFIGAFIACVAAALGGKERDLF